jgi:phosphopantothenoylcysteine decarboxylase/phosphopantothenate--cysteine ligase
MTSTIVLGVSGGIAAYKAVELCRRLVDAGVHVAPVMTDDAQRFVGAVTLSALASEPVRTSLFDGPDPIPHTRLGQTADLVVVAPATAKLIGKYAAGISDDLLTATLLATRAPVLVCPAMHTEMWEHPAVQENLATLRRRGVHVLEPETGRLAGGDVGAGRLADPERIAAVALALLAQRAGPLAGVHVLVSAGGTREPIDAVRVISNRSSGKQGYAIAAAAARRGASVTLVTTVGLPVPDGVDAVVRVETAAEMQDAVVSRAANQDVIVMAAAVADFRPKVPATRKTKKEEGPPEIVLEPTHDFLVDLGARKPAGLLLVGFAAETDDLVANATDKLRRKRLDLIVGNHVGVGDSGFDVDTNRAVLVDAAGGVEELPLLTKAALAEVIVDRITALHSHLRGDSVSSTPGSTSYDSPPAADD